MTFGTSHNRSCFESMYRISLSCWGGANAAVTRSARSAVRKFVCDFVIESRVSHGRLLLGYRCLFGTILKLLFVIDSIWSKYQLAA